ncbi:MAG: aminodeoxychorismate synthase component I [Gammaproteobacteria bacterium]|nr:aminodeoxychorismate synthase component I [Gammaproteobacteria bacterium]
MKQAVVKFPYAADSTVIFDGLAHRPWSVFLDSGRPYSEQGRYDILTADPRITLVTRGRKTQIQEAGLSRYSLADPFALVQDALGEPIVSREGIPFGGGAIGYFGYDLGRRLERLPNLAQADERIPEMAVAIYDWALVVDHRERRSRLVGPPHRLQAIRELLSRGTSGEVFRWPPFRVLGPVTPNMTRHRYLESVRRIKRYIRDGDCYQVNFAQRFAAPAEGSPWDGYKGLRRLNFAPFGAYLNSPYCQVMSSSPERFLQCREGMVETRPIKGTCPRGKDPIEDLMRREALQASTKDRAENLMIVDLLRNDLGRVCAIGSIEVPELFKLESFSRVHHLVSTVTGRLGEGETATSLLRACFPGGSITGAPKIRAMEVIEALEPQRRGVYCGAIGYLGFDGAMDTNIAIRTLVYADGMVRFWAGGGIVDDSDPELEYQETYHKAAPLLELLAQKSKERCG